MIKRFFLFIVASIIAFGAYAQTLSTGNPDVRGKVTGCVAEGKEVFVDFTLINVTDDEIYVNVATDFDSAAYDDEGNVYNYRSLAVLNDDRYETRRGVTLVPQVPVKFRLKIVGVPTSVSEMPYIKIASYNSAVKKYTFKGVGIERY